MQLEEYLDFVGSDACDPASSDAIRIKGHQIGIEQVLAYYHADYKPDEIAAEFPSLELEHVKATIAYYLHNRPAIDLYLSRLKARNRSAYKRWAAQIAQVIQSLCESQTGDSEESQE